MRKKIICVIVLLVLVIGLVYIIGDFDGHMKKKSGKENIKQERIIDNTESEEYFDNLFGERKQKEYNIKGYKGD